MSPHKIQNIPVHDIIFLAKNRVGKGDLLIKKGIWIYFILIIFEGALRRWIFPSLASPLLIVRDPIAIWLIFMSIKHRLLVGNFYVIIIAYMGFIGIVTAIIFGHGNIIVAIYGARILLLHFPLIFIIGRLFTYQDVIKIGKVVLWMTIPMTILIIIQFYSPQSAWVNLGVGGDKEGAGFSGALDFFRPPGTFSFTTGVTLYYSFASTFLLFFLVDSKYINKVLLIISTIFFFIAIPFSMSRGLFFQVCVTIFFSMLLLLKKPKHLLNMVFAVCSVLLVFYTLGQTVFFRTSIGAFISRFEDAGLAEGGLKGTIGTRFLGLMISAITESEDLPFWGYGIGRFTNVGSLLITGKKDFLNGQVEVEWGRIVYESGILLGVFFILVRLKICIRLLMKSYRAIKTGNYLPWMLLSFGFLIIGQGQWAQPNTLGFSTLTGGLILASLKTANQHKF
jgi:hypothetical protein